MPEAVSPWGKKPRRTGGQALVDSLAIHGVRVIFGIPGSHNLAAYDALADVPEMRHITTRHEEGAAFMADGYARAGGRAGVCFTTTGPAALNTLTALGTAYGDSSPVLVVSSQIPSSYIGQQKGFLHECRDQLTPFAPVTCWRHRVVSVNDIGPAVREAFLHMRSGRPRPAMIEIPCDILDERAEVTIPEPAPLNPIPPDPEQLARAVELLRHCVKPVIWVDGGLITEKASAALSRLADSLQAPVFTTPLGKGSIPDDHLLAVGCVMLHPAARKYLKDCDLMLAVGTRLGAIETDHWALPIPEDLIHLDADPAEIGRNYPATVGLAGDIRLALEQLAEKCRSGKARISRHREVAQLRAAVWAECRGRAPLGVDWVRTLQSCLPRDAILVNDLTIAAYWCQMLLDVYQTNGYLYPWNFCTLGFGLPAAVGARIAQPDRPVVLITGDGGFLFNSQELAVAAQHRLPLVILLFNDSAYGVLGPQQERRYGRSFGIGLHNPDFPALAEAFGARGQRVESLEELAEILPSALEQDGPHLIEIPISLPWPPQEQKF